MTKNEIVFWAQTISISLDVSTIYISELDELIKIYEENPFYKIFPGYNHKTLLDKYLKFTQERIVYSISTPIKVYYLLMCLNKKSNENLIIGPFMDEYINEEQVMKLKSSLELSDSFTIELKKYFATLPVIERGKLMSLSSLFLEKYYNSKGPYPLNFIGSTEIENSTLDLESELDNDVPLRMIEERYKRENQFLDAVSKGDFPSAYIAHEKMMSNLTTYYKFNEGFNSKSRGITILSVLLRKAAESGGVHPLHLENLSTKYTLVASSQFKIDDGIIVKMIKDYCTLVKEYSLTGVSPLMRDAINYINFNLNSDLNVSSIADYLCITPNYLYRIFKKESGLSVIDYVNQKRIKESMNLLKKTDMQIQMVAEKVGINDISYFSRLFKKQVGKSPTEYKKEMGK